jgi:hypothetical protein
VQKLGSTRKSRRARLPSSSYGGRKRFTPSNELWRRMEKAMGASFDAMARHDLIHSVDAYFAMQPFEGAAPFANEAEAWLDQTKAHVDALLLQVSSQDEAAFFVQRQLAQHLRPGKSAGRESWDDIVRFMAELAAAGALTASSLKRMRTGGFVEGAAWAGLIRDLTRLCKAQSLPTGASKGANKSRHGRPSSFVAFVEELQRAFPLELRRHSSSQEALAKAISSARRTPKAGP